MRAGRSSGSATTEEIDEALRLAKGFVIVGPTPLSATTRANFSTIEVWSFQSYFLTHNSIVSYNGGSIAGLSPNTMYYVYFEDPEERGGARIFTATPVRYLAVAGPKRLYVGRIRTPPPTKG
jgi:hypothetical protein